MIDMDEMRTDGPMRQEFNSLFYSVTPIVAREFGEGRTGGYVCLMDPQGHGVLNLKGGEIIDWERRQRCITLSNEKPERLLKHPDHLLSWQSRNPDNTQYGGAIRLPSQWLLGFSGFLEMDDEAFVASLARCMKWVDEAWVKQTLSISDNVDRYRRVHQCVVGATMPA